MRVREGEKVRVKGGWTTNHDDERIDVEDMTGTVVDYPGYEKSDTGEHMVGVKLDAEHGGGDLTVQENRLRAGRSFSFAGVSRDAWDRIFGRRD